MRCRAICPACVTPVPLAWYLRSRARPCPICGVRIQPVRRWDKLGSIILGVFGGTFGLAMGVFLVFRFRLFGPWAPIVICLCVWGLPGLLGLVLYRTMTPFELVESYNVYCATCGYDLRASHDRCPECGAAVPPALPPMADAAAPRDQT